MSLHLTARTLFAKLLVLITAIALYITKSHIQAGNSSLTPLVGSTLDHIGLIYRLLPRYYPTIYRIRRCYHLDSTMFYEGIKRNHIE